MQPSPTRYRSFIVPLLLAIIANGLITGCGDDTPAARAAPATTAPAISTTGDTTITTPSTAVAPTRAERLEKLRAGLLKAEAEAENTSPYQIQLGVEEDISFTIIGDKPDLNLNFTNQDGVPINLASAYAGKILVISTIYTSCEKQEMCPRLTADFAELADALPADLRAEVQLILVSFDPQRDTPDALKAYGLKHLIDFEITDLLCGPIDQTRPLLEDALQIPLEVNPETNMILMHAMMLHIIDRNGYIVVERSVSTSGAMEAISREIIRAALLPFDAAKVPATDEDTGAVITTVVEDADAGNDGG